MSTTLYVGDVHGCAAELSLLLDQVQPDRVVLVGDLFTKGPDPVGVWSLIRRWKASAVMGNHDAAVLRRWKTPRVAALREAAPELAEWLRGLPLFIHEPERIVVHAGVHPLRGVAGTTRRLALNMRRWPDDQDEDNPFWYDAGWQGPRTVVFGHDARRGLVRREVKGRPVAIGLDTGCVYGGQLSGWVAEEDRIVQVPAARVYKDPTGRRRSQGAGGG